LIGLYWTIAAGILSLCPAVSGQPDPNSPTTQWVPILYGPTNSPDVSGDQQAGGAEEDLVGNQSEPSFYMQYVSGYLGFRLRLGGDVNPAGFRHVALVGLDVNPTGDLNLFIGVNNRAGGNQIGIWSAGPGANTSPSTTSIGSQRFSYSETSLDYSFTSVNSTMDPTAVNFDLNADGRPDRFLSFFVPFADIVSAFSAQNITFTTNSPIDLVALTANRLNNINGDINGPNGGIGSSQLWAQLGALSQPIAPAPEPSEILLSCLAGTAVLCIFRRRRT